MMTDGEKLDAKQANEVIQNVMDAQQKELYFIKFKVKKANAANPMESIKVINWIPVIRPIVLNEEEYKFFTEGMKDNPIASSIIMQLLRPELDYQMSAPTIEKAAGLVKPA